MPTLHQFRLCPHSRAARLALTEAGIAFDMVEQRPWEWRAEFLSLNPAGELPVLEVEDGPVLCGLYSITEFIADEPRRPGQMSRAAVLLPGGREDRAEVRRLVDWFARKLDREVTSELLAQRVYKPLRRGAAAPPDAEAMRAIQANLRYHMSYIGFLAYQRRWLAGDEMSLADLVAAAHFSTLDYLGEVPWAEHAAAKEWYSRIKSRPSLRPLLADRQAGLPPPLHYTNLDF